MVTIEYRPVEARDLKELKALHELFFPLNYGDAFYDRVVKGIGIHGKRLFTVMVIEKVVNDNNENIERLIGFVLAQYIHVNDCGDENIYSYSFFERTKFNKVCYILTIGILDEYRKQGIASKLLSKVINYAKSNPKCGCVYLHVIDYNKEAMLFYEKNNFISLRYIEGFYTINSKPYNAYLYIYYVNGGVKHRYLSGIMSEWWYSLWSSIANNYFVPIFQPNEYIIEENDANGTSNSAKGIANTNAVALHEPDVHASSNPEGGIVCNSV